MKRVLPFLFLLMVVFCPMKAYAADTARPDIDMPTSIAVENKNDITFYTLTELLGNPFKEVAGKPASEGPASFSNLLIGILSLLNLIAMFYVGSSVLYLWVIFAATTAHNGEKLGGGVYDSLWVPMRQAGAFVLTVPILNGLSVMQMLLIACVSISINFANTIWDAACKYMVEHANLGIIETAVPSMDESVYRALPMMFRDSVVQQIDRSLVKKDEELYPMKYKEEKDVSFWPVNFSGKLKDNVLAKVDDGVLMFFLNKQRGEARIQVRTTTNMVPDSIGMVAVTFPPGEKSKRNIYSYALKEKIAGIKLKYLAKIYGTIYNASTVYLQSRASSSGDSGCAFAVDGSCRPASAAETAISNAMTNVGEYIKKMTEEVNKAVKDAATTQNRQTIENMVSDSLDITDGKSRYGWATAGLFNLSLALLQQEFNESVLSSISSTPRSSLFSGKFKGYYAKLNVVLPDRNKESAITRADEYFNSIALNNGAYARSFLKSSYNKNGKTDEGLGLIQSLIVKQFAGDSALNQATYSGILGIVLAELGSYDPIVVMQNFGSKIFSAMADNWGKLTLGSAASAVALGVPFTVLSVFLIITLGCFFCYVVPVIPFIFWLMALVSWLFMVIEAMVAAPFWVCTHVMPEGRGFVGDHARKGYMLLLELISRPPLLVVGAVFAVAMCQTIGWMLNRLLAYWFGNMAANFIAIDFVADIIYTILVLSLVYYVYYMVFTKGVIYMPEAALKWCGAGSGMGLQGGEQTLKKVLTAGGTLSVASTAGTLAVGGNAIVGGMGRAAKHLPPKAVDALKKMLGDGTGSVGENKSSPKKKPIAQIAEKTDPTPSPDKPENPKKPNGFAGKADKIRKLIKGAAAGKVAGVIANGGTNVGSDPDAIGEAGQNQPKARPVTSINPTQPVPPASPEPPVPPQTPLAQPVPPTQPPVSPIQQNVAGRSIDSLTGNIS